MSWSFTGVQGLSWLDLCINLLQTNITIKYILCTPLYCNFVLTRRMYLAIKNPYVGNHFPILMIFMNDSATFL